MGSVFLTFKRVVHFILQKQFKKITHFKRIDDTQFLLYHYRICRFFLFITFLILMERLDITRLVKNKVKQRYIGTNIGDLI